MKPTEFQGVRLYGEEHEAETVVTLSLNMQAPDKFVRYKGVGVARKHPNDRRDAATGFAIATVRALEDLASTLRDRIKERRGIDF